MKLNIRNLLREDKIYYLAYKIAKHFGVKPMFLYYDESKKDVYFKKLGKKHVHQDLIYINGVSLKTAFKLYLENIKTIQPHLFWVIDKKNKKTILFAINEEQNIFESKEVDGMGFKYISPYIEEYKEVIKKYTIEVRG